MVLLAKCVSGVGSALFLVYLLDQVEFLLLLRWGTFVFSLTDIQEMDALVSSFSSLAMKEAGSLFLTWAVFLRLIASLPGNENDNVLKACPLIVYYDQYVFI